MGKVSSPTRLGTTIEGATAAKQPLEYSRRNTVWLATAPYHGVGDATKSK
jgi:hypothetical protein